MIMNEHFSHSTSVTTHEKKCSSVGDVHVNSAMLLENCSLSWASKNGQCKKHLIFKKLLFLIQFFFYYERI